MPIFHWNLIKRSRSPKGQVKVPQCQGQIKGNPFSVYCAFFWSMCYAEGTLLTERHSCLTWCRAKVFKREELKLQFYKWEQNGEPKCLAKNFLNNYTFKIDFIKEQKQRLFWIAISKTTKYYGDNFLIMRYKSQKNDARRRGRKLIDIGVKAFNRHILW